MDMVRAGIILYGMFPSNEVSTDIDLRSAMSIKTHISYVKELPAGVGVGYGRKYYTDKLTKIATVPIGYADGYSRRLSNKARMIVGGEYANVIGNVCMDQLMLDITHIPNVNMGDEVIVMGSCGDKCISAEELGELMGTINYEVVCGIGKRVPRVYVKNNVVVKTVALV
jgi:alanine racemase